MAQERRAIRFGEPEVGSVGLGMREVEVVGVQKDPDLIIDQRIRIAAVVDSHTHPVGPVRINPGLRKADAHNSEKEAIEEKLADNSLYDEANKEQLKQLLSQQSENTQALRDVEEQWLMASEEIESLQD